MKGTLNVCVSVGDGVGVRTTKGVARGAVVGVSFDSAVATGVDVGVDADTCVDPDIGLEVDPGVDGIGVEVNDGFIDAVTSGRVEVPLIEDGT